VFELSAGQIVADKYRIDGVMGTGGMGVVVAATHVELDQRVAIKFLRVLSTEALARFQREARLLVRLKSPHVARVIDVGSLDDDTPYIVMEHLDGEDLSFVVAGNKKLPVEETVDYILQACEAVAEAHALGMVHRDLKPANVFVARGAGGTKSVKVLDFGVSKILDERSAGASDAPRDGDLTNEGVALGSPGYMSPEQMTSARDVDERSDIFSLGAMLYRLVTGQPAYKGGSPVSILAAMAIDGLVPVRSVAPEVPDAFARVVERCLAQEKTARYSTVAHLAQALAPFATRRGRVSIEQILATLNIRFDDEPLADTMTQTVVARGGAVTGPQLMAPPASMPPQLARREATPRPVAQLVAVAVTLLLLSVVAGVVVFRALRPARASAEEPRPALTAVAVAAAPPVAVPPIAEPPPVAPLGAAVAALGAAGEAPGPPPGEAPAPPAFPKAVTAAAEPKPRPAPVRARPQVTSAHTTATSTGPSPPPNAADVPGGRR
jgi:eukaryotic-like serine/threonine-protein kinase